MNPDLTDIIELSHYFGGNKEYVIAGGGNTSFKDDMHIWVKASGASLSEITAEGFAVLDRSRLQEIGRKKYNPDPSIREAEVKNDLYAALLPGTTARPSVETSLHELIAYPLVVHTHPTLVNAVTCSVRAQQTIQQLFGREALFIPYTDPGYTLFTVIRDRLTSWRKENDRDPEIIFLENHGVFVASETARGIKELYSLIDSRIRPLISRMPDAKPLPVPDDVSWILPAMRMILSRESIRVGRMASSALIQHFVSDVATFRDVSRPFTPDQIVYCKAHPLFIENEKPEDAIREFADKLDAYVHQHGCPPKVVALKKRGVVAFDDNMQAVETVQEVFGDLMKISFLTKNFGGPHFLDQRSVSFIDSWEAENYRRQAANAPAGRGRVANKVVIITGGAQGFGGGIAESFSEQGANVIIADLNEEKGREMETTLNVKQKNGRALFVKTDVSDPESVKHLMTETVKNFTGFDVLVSNAGILHAGGLEEMTPEVFGQMTRVNYTGYFLCVKYGSEILRLQSRYHPSHFTDIIQINSKSGLRGSNRNFAYAGGKFGGIGLTQSFALELIPFRIKVNSICPGNFFEGPLWSDPEKGLFVQYLQTGKVPGAKTIEEVRAYYERQIPAGRGCRIQDVMKAIYYAIDQEYETGQAIPVTGGQEMLR